MEREGVWESQFAEVPGAGRKTLTVNMGPQHPSTHGVLRIVLELDGETIVKASPVIGYVHTGIEKNLEHKPYQKGLTMTDRTDYLAPMSNNLGLCLAVEKLLGVEVPPRAQCLRVLMAELTRIASHLVWLGTHAMDVGAVTVFLYCFREREKVLDLYEMVGGQRMTPTYIRVGGVAADVPEGFFDLVKAFLSDFPGHIAEYEGLLKKNRIWVDRLVGVGKISAAEAINLGFTGPNLRACGVRWDLRKTQPYSGYENYEFEIPLGETGDNYDRYQVRMEEMRQSARICRQCLERMPDGPVRVQDPDITPPQRPVHLHEMEAMIQHFKIYTEGFRAPEGEVYFAIESPRGELGYYVVGDGSARPYRVHIRAPAFVNLGALDTLARGHLVADLVAIIGSIDPVLGEIDR